MIPIFNPQRIAFSMNKRRFKSLQDKAIITNLRELNQSLPDYDQNAKLSPDIDYSLHLPWMGVERYYPKTPQLINQDNGEVVQDFAVKLYRINLVKNEEEPLTKQEEQMWLSFGYGAKPYNDAHSVNFDALTLAQPAFDQKLLQLIMKALEILEQKAIVVAPRFTLNNVRYRLYLDGVPK